MHISFECILKHLIRSSLRTGAPSPQGDAFFYLLFSMPQSHSRSSTATSECPRSVSEYSTFGGICGKSWHTGAPLMKQ